MATAPRTQLIALIVVAVILGAGLFALDRYSDGQKAMLTVESRGIQMVSALTRYRQDTGSYPGSLDKMVPKYAPATSKCPDGQAIGYRVEAGEYVLSCQNVIFKQQPYSYSSRTKAWSG